MLPDFNSCGPSATARLLVTLHISVLSPLPHLEFAVKWSKPWMHACWLVSKLIFLLCIVDLWTSHLYEYNLQYRVPNLESSLKGEFRGFMRGGISTTDWLTWTIRILIFIRFGWRNSNHCVMCSQADMFVSAVWCQIPYSAEKRWSAWHINHKQEAKVIWQKVQAAIG